MTTTSRGPSSASASAALRGVALVARSASGPRRGCTSAACASRASSRQSSPRLLQVLPAAGPQVRVEESGPPRSRPPSPDRHRHRPRAVVGQRVGADHDRRRSADQLGLAARSERDAARRSPRRGSERRLAGRGPTSPPRTGSSIPSISAWKSSADALLCEPPPQEAPPVVVAAASGQRGRRPGAARPRPRRSPARRRSGPRSGWRGPDRRRDRGRSGRRAPRRGRPAEPIPVDRSLTATREDRSRRVALNQRARVTSARRHRAPAAARVARPPAAARPLLLRLPGLSARARAGRRQDRPGVRQRRVDRRRRRSATGTFFEPGLQRALLDDAWLIDIANWLYVNTHFVITTTFLAWLLPVPQRALPVRPQHVHGRDGDRPGRLRAGADGAAAACSPARDSPTRSPASPRSSRTATPSACWSTSTRRCRACTAGSP